jgi:hypothetical protein
VYFPELFDSDGYYATLALYVFDQSILDKRRGTMPGWITDPPVMTYKKTDWVTCRTLSRKLKSNIGVWAEEGAPYATTDAISMCDMICESVHHKSFKEDDVFFAYIYSGAPLALMFLSPVRKEPYVNDIVAHPGAEGGGATLIEFSLNYLKKIGQPVCLKLWALNDRAVGPYLGMGFTSKTEKQDMFLDPNQSDKWKLIEGRWYYTSARNPGQKYASPL